MHYIGCLAEAGGKHTWLLLLPAYHAKGLGPAALPSGEAASLRSATLEQLIPQYTGQLFPTPVAP